ncbi:uncharacterized protein CANTADRAFT_6335 [Suhomyces tanzawaensis NRRL Y-17324]|uniref:Uncharacterized protein n=1 Tax=Suhomyces tanzawaensis NRRL Y-17324 TaxID=984487 RepID=A0A1E4SI23_9ASCO|nr:uncharacterized protein CANTADRAFT_6335 [Suhomyces tanzawaensis NRRL Y-17324]ODV79164.1 hypothetical protein CANTADRAFT_6335 [Suhomyces tanzawaensis NRRL Y-17324]
MVPLPTSDRALLGEHAFYETGNLKHVMPFMKFQNYDLVLKRYNHGYAHTGHDSGVNLKASLLMVAFGVLVLYFVSKKKMKPII